MQTVKTALVVVALLGVLFVGYRVLNNQPIGLPFDLAGAPLSPDSGFEATAGLSVEAPPVDSTQSQTSWPDPAGGQNEFPSIAGLSPPPFAVTPPGNQVATSPSPQDSASDYAQQVANVAPIASDVSPGGNPRASLLDTPLRPAPSAPTGSDSSSSDAARSPLPGQVSDAGMTQPPPPGADASSRGATAAVTKYSFEQAWQKAELQIADGQLARALLTLSAFYRNPDLDEGSQSLLNERLDQLAGTVIYSKRHLLEEAYKANRGDTLQDLAARYSVSAKLLQNINGIEDPSIVLPGTELKLVRGPLRAEIDLARGEATMFLGGLYAGRFAIRPGRDPAPKPGEYQVLAIDAGRTYYLPSGQTIPKGAAVNPYGQWWIDLGGEQGIHGSPEAGAEPNSGCLSLAPRDAADVAAILSVGSKVVIR